MKLTVTQLRNIIKTEVKRLGGKGLNEAPRKGLAPKPVARPKTPPRVTNFDGTVGGLSTALQQFPGDMPVMFGENGKFVPARSLDEIGMAGSVVFAPAAGRPITVGGLIYELSDFDDAGTVMFGKPGAFVPAREVERIDFDEHGMMTGDGVARYVCIMPETV